MQLEMCIPAFNEGRIIAGSMRSVMDVLERLPLASSTLTVADNASTDDTAVRAKEVSGATVLRVPQKGKGAAIVEAARISTADFFGFIDADLSASPEDILPLFEKIRSGECDVAIGSRLLNTEIVDRGSLRTFSSRAFNLLRKLILGIEVLDTQCGLKLMNEKGRAVLAACTETGWFFDLEFLARAERRGLVVLEIPVHWNEHRFPERPSKLSFMRDGFGALAALMRIRRALRRS